MNQKTDRVLFGWLILASFFGVLAGVPWTLAVLRGHPGTAWWWEGAFSLLFLIAASAAGTWLGKRADLGSGLRELVSGTPGCWKRLRLALVPGTLVGLALGLLGIISQGAVRASYATSSFPVDCLNGFAGSCSRLVVSYSGRIFAGNG